MPQRNDPQPRPAKELPQKISGLKLPTLSADGGRPRKDLLRQDAGLGLGLRIAKDVETAVAVHAADPVHDKLAARALVKHDVAAAQGRVRPGKNTVSRPPARKGDILLPATGTLTLCPCSVSERSAVIYALVSTCFIALRPAFFPEIYRSPRDARTSV